MTGESGTVSRHGAAITHRERVRAALRGDPVDRPPISLWHHFPGRDGTAELLAENTLEFQRRLDLDLIKLMPTGMYSVMDYGVQVRPDDGPSGTTRFASGPIHGPADWGLLPEVSPQRGSLKAAVGTVRLLRAALGPDVPLVQTVFSPLTMAAKMVGGDIGPVILGAESQLRGALDKMAEDVVAFGRACLDAGADGFFFATQHATRTALPEGVYQRFGVPYDVKILEGLRPGAWCTMIHLHGIGPLFELADLYPVDAVNWHDRESEPSLAQALSRTRRCLVGGIQRRGAVATGTADQVIQEVGDAIAQTGGQRLIVAPACVIPTAAPLENLLAARRAVEPGWGGTKESR